MNMICAFPIFIQFDILEHSCHCSHFNTAFMNWNNNTLYLCNSFFLLCFFILSNSAVLTESFCLRNSTMLLQSQVTVATGTSVLFEFKCLKEQIDWILVNLSWKSGLYQWKVLGLSPPIRIHLSLVKRQGP